MCTTRRAFAAGFILLGLGVIGCKNQGGSASQSGSAPLAQAPGESGPPVAPASAQAPASVNSPLPSASPEEDDASLLARKTSEYAQNMSRLLARENGVPATRPSIVEWADPSTRPSRANAPAAVHPDDASNPPAAMASAHLTEDTSVPLILPESADQIPQATARSASSPSAAGVAVSTDNYEQKLQKLVRDYPRDLGNQLDYQLLRFVRGEQTPDLADVTQLSSEDRDILLTLMDGLNNFRNGARADENLMLSRKIRPLLEMADRLRSQAELSIPTIALCTQVNSYGDYRPVSSMRFPAGREVDVIVYCEVANFTSVEGGDRIWRTRLNQALVLYTDTGLAVWPEQPGTVVFKDQSRNRRHDFFIPREIRLPSSLAPGRYVLKATLTDEQSNRVAEASTALEIVAAPAPTTSDSATQGLVDEIRAQGGQ